MLFCFSRLFLQTLQMNKQSCCELCITVDFFDVKITALQQAKDDILHVFPDVSGLGNGRRVRNGKRHVQQFGETTGKQGFALTCWAN